MFEAMLAAIPDQAFYEKREIPAQIREAYLDSEIPYGCLVAGAKIWDLTMHPDYPVFSLCKRNNEDNKIFVPFRDANLILSSIETGELFSLMIREDDGKMPLPNKKPFSPPVSDLPVVKSYSVNETWRTIRANQLPASEGWYQAFVHVGNFQSESYQFHVVRGERNPRSDPFERSLAMEPAPADSAYPTVKATFGEAGDSSPVSKERGLVFHVEKRIQAGETAGFQLHATYRFEGKWKTDWKRVPVHALISAPGWQQPAIRTLWIPRRSIRFLENGYAGKFEFDLAEAFIAFPGQKPKIPPSAWVSFVHRDWHGPITRVDFGMH